MMKTKLLNAAGEPVREEQLPMVIPPKGSEAAEVLGALERMSSNGVDVKEGWQTFREMMLERSRVSFHMAFSRMQPELPGINKRGRIVIKDKNDPNKIIQSTAFARLEDIQRVIEPILFRHAFSLWHRSVEPHVKGCVRIVTTLAHSGYEQESEYELPLDTTGSKNNIQGGGSSTSYAKRYNICNLLNIRVEGEDDDATGTTGDKQTPAPNYITEQEATDLVILTTDIYPDEAAAKAFRATICKAYGVPDLMHIPAGKYGEVRARIENHGKAKKNAAGK